jgi:hypothetical protein
MELKKQKNRRESRKVWAQVPLVWNAEHCSARKSENRFEPSNARRSVKEENHTAARWRHKASCILADAP